MNRAELKTIAEGFKAVRPPKMAQGFTNAVPAGLAAPADQALHYTEVESFAYVQWRRDVQSIASALQLDLKARSNFEAACGLLHSTEG